MAERCIHGLDSRFCAVCNKAIAAARPRRAIGSATLDDVLRFLNEQQVRATYAAVAEVLGVTARGVGAALGARRVEASWIVNAETGLPTGYAPHELHPALLETNAIISSGTELAMRMTAWKGK